MEQEHATRCSLWTDLLPRLQHHHDQEHRKQEQKEQQQKEQKCNPVLVEVREDVVPGHLSLAELQVLKQNQEKIYSCVRLKCQLTNAL